MTTCKMCLKRIPKIKGRRSTDEPKFSICKECQKRRQQIIAKHEVDQSSILSTTIQSLVDCSSEAFETSAEQVRLKHRIWAANGEMEDTFPGLKKGSDQTRLSEFGV